MPDIFNAKVYKSDADTMAIASGGALNVASGGDINVASGGDINVASGGAIKYNGNACNVVAGEVTLDGSNPTTVATGLTTIAGASASIKKTTSPGDDPVALTVSYSGGTLSIYAWKTDGTDPTLVASTDNATVVSYVAVGA